MDHRDIVVVGTVVEHGDLGFSSGTIGAATLGVTVGSSVRTTLAWN